MSNGFWDTLPRPIMALAPMAGVTDAAFRRLVATYGKPDVCFTEFVSCAGLCSEGREKLLPDLWFDDSERPVVAQIFGPDPAQFTVVAELLVELGFDGIDINTGCPDRNVEKQGAGAALIREPARVKEIVAATKAGAGDLPVSVKTRIGYDSTVTADWVAHLLEAEPAAVTLHARTRQEMSKVPARWEEIAVAATTRDRLGSRTLILGNGDVRSVAEAERLAAETGADGVMLGRAIYGNPWLFNRAIELADVSCEKRLDVLLEHARAFDALYGKRKHFAVLRKYFKSYVAGMDEAKALRVRLMETNSLADVEQAIADYRAARKTASRASA
jgi:nifR3 family TIM-barrel protein